MMPADVPTFLAAPTHAREAESLELRAWILAAVPTLEEHVKWNAPSFLHDGVDRLTIRLQPGDRLELILHRGAKVRADAATFRGEDPTGLVRWITPDGGVVVIADAADLSHKRDALTRLTQAWIGAMTGPTT